MIGAAMQTGSIGGEHGRALKLHRDCGFGEVSIAAAGPETRANVPIPETGTVLAINYLRLGVAAHSTPKATGRGGARNHARRESQELSEAHVGNLIASTHHASAIGLPFTRMITVHWEAAGVPLDGMAKATGHFVDLLTKALARHGNKTAWLWVHENGPQKGGHCHLLAHVPAEHVKRLSGLQRGWLRLISGSPYQRRVIHSVPIGGRLGLEVSNPELHAVNLAAALGYVLKGAPQDVLAAFGIERAHEAGGRVIGRRCSTSQNISAKARNGSAGL